MPMMNDEDMHHQPEVCPDHPMDRCVPLKKEKNKVFEENTELLRITERQGEQEFDWYTLSSPDVSDKEVLEQFFGELDENDGEQWYTNDWCSAVWIYSRTPINEEEIAILKKFIII